MSRYISYDDLDYRGDKMVGQTNLFMSGVQFMIDRINEAPSIDICFCKDCVKHNTHRCHMAFDLAATEDDDFCSYGEREGE